MLFAIPSAATSSLFTHFFRDRIKSCLYSAIARKHTVVLQKQTACRGRAEQQKALIEVRNCFPSCRLKAWGSTNALKTNDAGVSTYARMYTCTIADYFYLENGEQKSVRLRVGSVSDSTVVRFSNDFFEDRSWFFQPNLADYYSISSWIDPQSCRSQRRSHRFCMARIPPFQMGHLAAVLAGMPVSSPFLNVRTCTPLQSSRCAGPNFLATCHARCATSSSANGRSAEFRRVKNGVG